MEMGEHEVDLSSKTFDSFVKKGTWVIDFWADWCNPCKIMDPHLHKAAAEKKGSVHFGRVDVDSELELADRFEVVSIPTLIFFKDGKQVNRVSGAISKDQIVSLVNESFK